MGGAVLGGGGTTEIVGLGGVVVVVLGRVVVVVVRGVVEVTGDSVVLIGGCVGTATWFFDDVLSPPRNAKKTTSPSTHKPSTAPATIRAALTYCSPPFVPRDLRISSAEWAARMNATSVPTTGSRMLAIATRSAAIANGSVRGASPHPPAPPEPDLPVGSGSDPAGNPPGSAGSHPSGYSGEPGVDIRGH